MRRLLFALTIIVFAGPAEAADSPIIRVYLDADPPNYVHEICSEPDDVFDVYVCLDCFGPVGGVRSTGVLVERTFHGLKLAQACLLAGPDFGDVEVDGWTLTSGEDCAYPDVNGIVCLGVVQYLYLGVPGTLEVSPHPGTGRAVLDCNFAPDYYCVHANLGVCATPDPGESSCDCMSYPHTLVVCEPQGGDNPSHPPSYWYDVEVGVSDWPAYGFSVQVFDPDIDNYTNWVEPEGWTNAGTVEEIDGDLWVSWCDPSQQHGLFGGPYRFGFDHSGASAWGHWTITGSGVCDPFVDLRTRSAFWPHETLPDGYGYRVHVPVVVTPVESATWGTIKALYR